MPKYISGRVKTTPVTGLTSDRYRYLSLADAEPNLGDPLVGPSSIGAKPITSGNKYQLFAVDGYPGERYWQQVQAQQLIPGSISVYEEGSLIGGLSSTTELDFRGTAITAEGLGGINPGYAVTITFAPPGNEKEIIFKESNDFATDATFTFDSSINLLAAGDRITVGAGGTVIITTASGFVGIGTTNPTGDLTTNYDPNLHVEGNIRLTGTIIDRLGDAGQAGFLLVKEEDVFGGLSWTDPANVTFGGAGDYRQVQFKGSTGLLEGGDLFYYDEVNNFVGIGSTQPNVRLDVIGASNFDGDVTIEQNLTVTQLATFNGNIDANGNLDVDGQTDLDVLNVSQLATFSGNIDANGNLDVDGQTDLDVLNVSQLATFSANLDINASVDIQNNLDVGGTLDVTGATDLASAGGITTTGGDLYVGNDLYVAGTFNIKDLEAETGNFTVSLQTVDFRATGISTLGNVKVSGNTVDTTGGNLILQANAQNNAQSIDVRNRIVLNNSTESTAVDNGSFETIGGVGIAKNLNVGGEVSFTGDGSGVDVTLASAGGITTTGGDLYVGGDFYVNQDANFKNLTVETLNVSVAATIANLTLDNPGISVTAILDEDNMISNRDDALATQQSIKAYVDTQVGNQDLDFVGDNGVPGAVDLDTQVFDIGGVIGDIKTTSSGQSLTIESDVTGVVAAGYGSSTRIPIITVNDKGKITAASDVDIDLSNVTVAAADRLTTPRTISFSEDVVAVGKTFDGTRDVGFALTLTSVFDGGTYGGENDKVLSLTVDDKGRITGITSVAIDFSSVGSAEKVSIATTNGSEEPYFLTFVADTSGSQSVYVGAGLSYYPTTELVDFDSNVRVNINKSFCLGDDTDYATWSYRSGDFACGTPGSLNRCTQDGLLITNTGKASIFEEQGAGPTVFKGLGSGDGAFWFVDNNWSTMLRMQATGSGGANFSFYNSGGSEVLQIVGAGLTVGGSVVPTADNTYDLGTSTKRWKTVYADTVCANNLIGSGGGGGDADRVSTGTTTGTGDYFLTFVDSNNTGSRTAEYLYTDAEIKYDPGTDTLKPTNLTVSSITCLQGNVDLGDSSSDTLIVNASVGSTIAPITTDVYDLGSSASLRWKTVYAQTICADNYCGISGGGGVAGQVSIATTTGGQEPYYLTFVANTSGDQLLYADSGLRYYPITNDLALDSNLLVCDNKTICIGNSQEFGLTYCLGNFAYDCTFCLGGSAGNCLERFDVSGNKITSQGKGAIFEETGCGPVLFRALGSGEGAFQFFSTNSNDPGCSTDPEQWVSLLKMHGGKRGFRLFQKDGNLEVVNITGAGVTVAGNIVPWVGANPQNDGARIGPIGNCTSGTFDLGSSTNKWNNVYANNFVGNITGSLSGNANTVSTGTTTGTGDYFLTFVDSNNNPRSAEDLYTDLEIKYNPNTNTLKPTNLEVANCLTVDQNARICGCLDVGPATVSINGVTNTITVGTGVAINPTTSCFNNLSVQTITPKAGGTYNLGASGNNFGTVFADNVCATNLYGTFSGSVSSSSSADQVKTQCTTSNGLYYLTFVDSNNASSTSETIYTNGVSYCKNSGSRNHFQIDNTCIKNYGSSNVIIGESTTGNCVTSTDNVLLGTSAGRYLVSGGSNVIAGPQAGGVTACNISRNVFLGSYAGQRAGGTILTNGTAVSNVAIGYLAGCCHIGCSNVFLGNSPGLILCGNENVIIGNNAGRGNTSNAQNCNVVIGSCAATYFCGSPRDNVVIGRRAGRNDNSCSYGCDNIFIGDAAGLYNPTGSHNIFLGTGAGLRHAGNCNIFMGYYMGSYNSSGNRNTAINGSSSYFNGVSNTIFIGPSSASAAYVGANWTTVSDINCKHVYGPVPHGREFLRGINPIKYSFKDEDTQDIIDDTIRYGFSAQEIYGLEGDEPVISRIKNLTHYHVTHDYLLPVLVNAIKELDAENIELKQRLIAIEQQLGINT